MVSFENIFLNSILSMQYYFRNDNSVIEALPVCCTAIIYFCYHAWHVSKAVTWYIFIWKLLLNIYSPSLRSLFKQNISFWQKLIFSLFLWNRFHMVNSCFLSHSKKSAFYIWTDFCHLKYSLYCDTIQCIYAIASKRD